MTLIGAILQKVKSTDSLRYPSPPPELEEERPHCKRKPNQYSKVPAKVDTSPPTFDAHRLGLHLPSWALRQKNIQADNLALVIAIKKMHFSRGRVDSRWTRTPIPIKAYYENRVNFNNRVNRDNRVIYQRILFSPPRVDTAESLRRDWVRNRRDILHRAQAKFVLFPPIPTEDIEDIAFVPPPDVKRPRVFMTLGIKNGAEIGDLQAELFTDVCPQTCQLFLELLFGDGVGYGYIGTRFFRKVPNLYWSGGDVALDNGFGCYAQRDRVVPIGAENYHFSHSMPGLLTMRVTCDDEMCGIFSITFKPLPQLDLKNVIFGRIIRPSDVYNSIVCVGSPVTSRPTVTIRSTRRRVGSHWVHGKPNTQLERVPLRIRTV